MICKPTVGEVRECACRECVRFQRRLRVDRGTVSVGTFTRIVEVAPCNRAKVTAGPPWMGAR
jgi:hypothetical protein